MFFCKNKLILFSFVILLLIPQLSASWFWNKRSVDFSQKTKAIEIIENDIAYLTKTRSNTVAELLSEKNISLAEIDQIIPERNTQIFPGSKVKIRRAVNFILEVDDKKIKGLTLSKDISQVLQENEITLGRLDKVSPSILSPVSENQKIIVTRINIEEKTVEEDIDFKTITKNDSKLGWREENIEQKGVSGIMEVQYKITYKNGKEISKVKLEKRIIQEPLSKIVVQGTHIKFGKSHTGLGTWYSQPAGIQKAYPSITGYYAANPWLPKGSYVKITNKANGKSLIAVINDRGPFGEGRIIDLDKKAFAEIASIGAGVINVKVEEITN